MLVGYARVSSSGQSLDVQLEQLQAAGCAREDIFSEKFTGTTTTGREQLEAALNHVRKGDVLLVTRLDRLARSIVDLRKTIDRLAAKGCDFKALQQGTIDTTRSDGKLLLNILASFAEFENDLRRERQAEGIAVAKATDKDKPREQRRYKGRPVTVDPAEVRRLAAEGLGVVAIAEKLGIGRTSVWRALKEDTGSG